MALYVPPSRRRRRLVITGVACLVVGVLAGLLIGRASITTTGEQIARVRSEAEDLATRVEALTIEYEQAIEGTGDSVQGGVLEPLDGIDREAARILALAAWLSPATRTEVQQSLAAVREAADTKVDPPAFADRTAAAAAVLRAELGA